MTEHEVYLKVKEALEALKKYNKGFIDKGVWQEDLEKAVPD